MAASQGELASDPVAFQQFLMARASAGDPRVSSAMYANNSVRRSQAAPSPSCSLGGVGRV